MAPAPGLARLDDLVAEFRGAGIDVRSSIEADVTGLDPVLDVCCYRVVEEALTNVARHSAARTATVSVRADDCMVRIVVADPGPARLPPPGPLRSGRGPGSAWLSGRRCSPGGSPPAASRTAGSR